MRDSSGLYRTPCDCCSGAALSCAALKAVLSKLLGAFVLQLLLGISRAAVASWRGALETRADFTLLVPPLRKRAALAGPPT